jgi:peptidyl-prolyl cis-trans isomerase C
MKYVTLSVCLCALAAYGQNVTPATPQAATPATAKKAAVAPDTVVLKVGEKPMTAAQFEELIAAFPPDIKQSAQKNPKQVIQSYYLMQSLTRQAEAEKLDQTSPVKEALALQRMQTLATAIVNRQKETITVSEEDEQKRYETDKNSKYNQARIRAIFITFGDPKAINASVDMSDPNSPKPSMMKGVRLEAEAKTIAEDLAKQAHSGADFAELAKAKSDDKQTGAKGGEFPVLHESDRLPPDLKKALFSMKPGEISDPIRQANGYYVLKLEERGIQPFSEVKQTVANELKQERFQQWMTDLQKPFDVTVENPAFFGAPSLQAPHPMVATPSK